jgi:Leucine-rich repeat (LRR) protein
MHLNSNLLTRVPPQLSKFIQLQTISLDRNFILSFSNNAFNFSRQSPKYLWLNNNRLNGIEAGAFQGTHFNLNKNLLITFHANVLTLRQAITGTKLLFFCTPMN